MNLKQLIENRYSIRAYLPQNVEEEKIQYILECARLSPSACNYQPWRLYVVTDKKKLSQIHKSYDREWFKTAPMCIVVCKDSSLSWKRANTDGKDHGDIDAAIVSQHICLAAHEQGLGTCWVCNFNPELLSVALDLSADLEPVAIFPIGYIDKNKSVPYEKKRKSLNDIAERL
ncbi:MAG: nitroreductase family protein [Dysgonomonas sp.]